MWYSYWLAASAATGIGADGAFTSGVVLTDTYNTPGIWMYFPANCITGSNVAGFYWTIMSSTTLGTVYNNVYTPGTTDPRDYPVSPTAFSGTTGSAITAANADRTMFSSVIPGGTLGPNGQGISNTAISTTTGGAPTLKLVYGGATIYTRTMSIGDGHAETRIRMCNTGIETAQKTSNVANSFGILASTAATKTAVDTREDQTAVLVLSVTTGTNHVLENFSWEILSA